MDRRLLVATLVVLASAALLAVGLFSILTTVNDDGVQLPSEGTIEDILGDAAPAADAPPDAPPGDRETIADAPPPPVPVTLSIPSIQIVSPVIALGLDPDRYPEVPDTAHEVAWYPFTAHPGEDSNAVFSAHVDWITRSGDPIPGADDLQYRVTGNVATSYDDPNIVKAMGSTSRDVITLITCGGTWQRDASARFGGNYSHRVVVRAELVTGLARAVDG
jgi:sortase (surface protein transpeptidase)